MTVLQASLNVLRSSLRVLAPVAESARVFAEGAGACAQLYTRNSGQWLFQAQPRSTLHLQPPSTLQAKPPSTFRRSHSSTFRRSLPALCGRSYPALSGAATQHFQAQPPSTFRRSHPALSAKPPAPPGSARWVMINVVYLPVNCINLTYRPLTGCNVPHMFLGLPLPALVPVAPFIGVVVRGTNSAG